MGVVLCEGVRVTWIIRRCEGVRVTWIIRRWVVCCVKG